MCAAGKSNIIRKLLKTLGWTLFTIVIVAGVSLFCAVKFLDSKYLAPWVEQIANEHIQGRLHVGTMKLKFRPHFPILGVEVDDLSIISHAFDSLSSSQRGLMPNYADSLVTLSHLSGAVDVKRLIVNNELALHDVVLRGLSVNLVIAHNGKANYEIVKLPTDTVKKQKSKMPGFRINRFALEDPREIRFYNAADSTSASVLLLTDAAVESDRQPTYRLRISGNVSSPKATLITNLEQIQFGLDGKVYWNPDEPGLVAMDEMEIQGAFIKAKVKGEIDLTENPIARKAVVELNPVALSDLLTLLPDSIRTRHRLEEPYFSTDLTIGARFELLKPMDLTTDTLPASKIHIFIPPSSLTYGKAQFKDLELNATVDTQTNLPDSTVIRVNRCVVEGPATRFEASALLATLFSDPYFSADMKGEIDLGNLPPIVSEKIPGYLSGIISTQLRANGSASMIKDMQIHRISADGSLTAKNLYFLSADTNKMVEVATAKIDFDTKRIINETPVLSTKLTVDTATLLIGGVDVAFSSLTLGAGVENTGHPRVDTALFVPLGGDLKVNRLNIISITDSAGARIREVGGHVVMRRHKGRGFLPEFMAHLQTGRVSAGTLSDRILINDAKIQADMYKLPLTPKKAPEAHHATVHKEYPYIAPAKVFKLVYEKRHHKPGQKRTRRVYTAMGADDNELLEWNVAKGFNKLLNEWKLTGSVVSTHARLLTPLFPLRNRFSRLEVKFSNDTVNISDISLRAGKSDIALSGLITNVRRALTAKSNNTLKANLSLLSDTIDINELSAGAFTGAAYAERRREGKARHMATDDDATLASRLDALSKAKLGEAPILIPVNVDANLKIGADNVLYSDLNLKDMGGDILIYDGGVNLHGIKAVSDAGSLSLSALYSAAKPDDIHFGFGMDLKDFNIAKFVKLVPAIDSITPLIHDFSGMINADIAATCRIDSAMNIVLPSLDAAIRITGDDLAFIDPKKYRTLGKWLGFKNKADNTIKRMNVEMTVADGLMRVYPFAFNIDRYRLGIYGSNDIAMNFDYHISVLKSPLPFKFGITISGNPEKHKIRFGGAKFKEDTAIESVSVVSDARINLIDQIENVFKRGVQNSRFAKLQVARPAGFDPDFNTRPGTDFGTGPDQGLTAADSLLLIQEGLLPSPVSASSANSPTPKKKDKGHHAKTKNKDKNKDKKDKDQQNKDKKDKDKIKKSKDPQDTPKKKRKRFLFF